ncbi:MAG: glycosyltransferase family 4 protein [Candidatus Moranbacteria bacterium]|nr:glycosyltransferase family 4 protein [Candidatus Moranbacteria bacterium]
MLQTLENKRILIFLRSFEIGGAERQAVLLANYLHHTEKAKVAVWAYSPPGPILDLLDKNIPHKSLRLNMENLKLENKNKRKADFWKLAIKILRFRPHIILPFTVTPNTDCGYVWKMTGAKACIWNQRDEWLKFLDYPENEIEVKAFKNTPVFISNSIRGKELIIEKLKKAVRKVYFIPNTVILNPPQKTRCQWRKELNIPTKSLVAVMVANLTENKDHKTLVNAWKIVIEQTKEEEKPVLLLAGRPDSTGDKLMSLSNELNIASSIRFLGFTNDIPGILEASDVAVFCSKSEGSPNGVLEPMASGLPVISYRIRGAVDVLGKDCPLFVSPGKEKELAKMILKVLADQKLRIKVGQDNYQNVRQNFAPEITFKKYSELLEESLAKSRRTLFETLIELWRFRKIVRELNKAKANNN